MIHSAGQNSRVVALNKIFSFASIRGYGLDSSDSEQGNVAHSCERSNEPSGSINCT
jgi:hypothetical protein